MLTRGSRLGPFEIVSPLGAGGMGEVWRATDGRLQRDVALKMLPADALAQPDRVARFEREARLLAALSHPAIATLFGVETIDGQTVLVMELAEGEDLARRLRRGPVPLPEAVSIARQVAEALEAAHEKGIVHRDVKPANIMITHTDEVKLMDFGLAAVVSSVTDRITSIRGTPFYMAPEQIMGEAVSGLTDQYALGCTIFHMVTGRPPFVEGDVLYHHIHTEPSSPRDWNPKIPAWLDAIILRMMRKSPTNRFPSLDVVQQEIERCLADSKKTGKPQDVAG